MCGIGVVGDGGGVGEGCEILRTKNEKFSILVRRQPSKPIKSVILKPSFLTYLFKRGVCAYGFRGNGERGMVVLPRWEGRTTDGFALVVRIFRVARVFRAF